VNIGNTTCTHHMKVVMSRPPPPPPSPPPPPPPIGGRTSFSNISSCEYENEYGGPHDLAPVLVQGATSEYVRG
jgi:hypothetical protein